ncbi:hemerythrin domain-containing protein [Biformimicrobium ophioploci]|nr:hypothetical protein [Microbulbifer sp. NKW57]
MDEITSNRAGIPALLAQLYSDHTQLLELLTALDHYLDRFQDCQSGAENLELLLAGLDYINTYPEKWHHPSESLLLEKLRERTTEKDIVDESLLAHNALVDQGKMCWQLFNSVANGCIVGRDQLVGCTRTFISEYRSHINQETAELFPHLLMVFGPDDWQEVERITPEISSALNKLMKQDYEQTREYVVSGMKREAAAENP